eukprot:1140378-Pelagomonas_calceolata.AAC.1
MTPTDRGHLFIHPGHKDLIRGPPPCCRLPCTRLPCTQPGLRNMTVAEHFCPYRAPAHRPNLPLAVAALLPLQISSAHIQLATGRCSTSALKPYLQQVSVQAVHNFLLQHNNKLFLFVSELMDIMLTGEDQSQVDQLNSLAEGPPV